MEEQIIEAEPVVLTEEQQKMELKKSRVKARIYEEISTPEKILDYVRKKKMMGGNHNIINPTREAVILDILNGYPGLFTAAEKDELFNLPSQSEKERSSK